MRPEKLELCSDGARHPDKNCFEGTLIDAVFQGDSVLMSIRLSSDHDVTVRVPNRHMDHTALPAIGESVAIQMHIRDTHLVPAS
jgi:putative spermidine/putrescine transport system ATP-binding protein